MHGIYESSCGRGFKMLLIALICLFSQFAVAGSTLYYSVQKDDQLLKIIHGLHLEPIHGPQGVWSECLNLNPLLIEKNGDYILPGQKIYISSKHSDVISQYAFISKDGEIRFSKTKNAESIVYDTGESTESAVESEEIPSLLEAPMVQSSPAYSELSLLAGASYLALNTNDEVAHTSGEILSGLSPGAEIIWTPHLTESLSLDLGVIAEKVKIAPSSSKTLLSRQQNLNSFYLGVNYQFTQELQFRIQGGYYGTLLLNSPTVSEIQIEALSIPKVQLAIRYKVLSNENFQLYMQGAYIYSFPFTYKDSYRGGAGNGFSGALQVEQDLESFAIVAETYYRKSSFKVTPVTFDTTEAGIQLGVKWKLEKTNSSRKKP